MSSSSFQSGDDRRGELHRVLSNSTRRSLLNILCGVDRTTRCSLALELAGVGTNDPANSRTVGETTQVEVALHHVHLPMLSEVGVIDYDPDDGTVETNDGVEVVYDALPSHPIEECR